ncbi:beta-glucosidase, partial [candidate division WOR-3 bacterium]|nr:beta-glucosidase [candidate division WOR-3 bacterium]
MKHTAILLLSFLPVAAFAQTLPYQNPKLPIHQRVEDLLGRMTLEERVAQMCQYVGIEHIRQSEARMSAARMKKSDAAGFYPGLRVADIERMTEQGEIGSFLHVVTLEEANALQKLAMKSRWRIPLLLGIDAIHGDGLVRGA